MIKYVIDDSELEQFIGAIYAFDEVVSDSRHFENLIKSAHQEAEEVFNVQAALSGGMFKHMFEWGTVGINNGKSNRRPQPTSEAARLWKNILVGQGKNQTLRYTFKPSVAVVPKPTVKKTGIDSGVLNSLSDHIFYNKAAVMELGISVSIAPVDAEALFIPILSDVTYAMARPYDIKRGYMMYPGTTRPITYANSKGTFTAFWSGFWNTTGRNIMEKHIQKAIEADLAAELAAADRAAGRSEPPSVRDLNAGVKAAQKKSAARMKAKGRARTV